MRDKNELIRKAIYKGDTYDFGYYVNDDRCVLYEEGCRNMQDAISVFTDEVRFFLEIESQIVSSLCGASYLMLALKLAKQAGYTHVRDNWAPKSYDEYTIDEAIEKFSNCSFEDESNEYRDDTEI